MISTSKYKLYSLIPIVFIGLLFISNYPRKAKISEKPHLETSKFGDYWNQGKAELTSYDLVQGRYGDLHQGSAVLIFVTEPFSKSKQVKLSHPEQHSEGTVNVLKMNFTKKFVTGIYDYSILQSVFTPIDLVTNPHTLKANTSVQEWCGHTFTQLNLQSYKYKVQLNSYFEEENDQIFQLDRAVLEDEIWNLIRIAPDKLPVGEIEMIPSLAIARLRHIATTVEEVDASLNEHETDTLLNTYYLDFINSKRTISIHFNKNFPHEIMGWEETYIEGGKELTTKATRRKMILSDYWNHHDLESGKPLRKELGLE